MTAEQIRMLPVEMRLVEFVARWEEMYAFIGNRTAAEHAEMAQISDAIMPHLIRFWKDRTSTRAAPEQIRAALAKAKGERSK
jgi:hypothetical protein